MGEGNFGIVENGMLNGGIGRQIIYIVYD